MNRTVGYTGVVARFLRDDERRVPSGDAATPLVLEPQRARDARFLEDFLAAHSSRVADDIAGHGAILLRGFDLRTPSDFERTVLSIRGMEGMNGVMMAEEGRTVVPGTRYVLYTNANFKTGGTVDPPMFHAENYYVPDVPRFISFFCITPSWIGGETGLVDLAGVYADLPPALQHKLEHEAFAVRDYPVKDVAARYGRSAGEVHEFCARAGLPIVTRDGDDFIVVVKPSVVEHPVTRQRALAINVSGELNGTGLARYLEAAFADDFSGARWAIHRFHWRHPAVIQNAALGVGLVAWPRRAWPYLLFKIGRLLNRPDAARAARPAARAPRVGDLFDPGDVEVLARAMRRRYSSFLWKRGDVLIADNLKMAHAGMPGFGPRNLKALICNCVALPAGLGSPGLAAPRTDDVRDCFGAQLANVPERAAAAAPA